MMSFKSRIRIARQVLHVKEHKLCEQHGILPKKHSEPSPEESQSPVSPVGNQETLPVALASAEKDKEAQPEDAGVIYDELLSLLMTEKPISTKVDWKFSGKIKMPRQAVSAAA
jgi:hypothetical protein